MHTLSWTAWKQMPPAANSLQKHKTLVLNKKCELSINNTENNSRAQHHCEAGNTPAAAAQRHSLELRPVPTEVSHIPRWTQVDQTCPPTDWPSSTTHTYATRQDVSNVFPARRMKLHSTLINVVGDLGRIKKPSRLLKKRSTVTVSVHLEGHSTHGFLSVLSFPGDHGHRVWSDNRRSVLRPSYKVQPKVLDPHVC